MRNRLLWILLGGIAVLSAAFLLLNFHAAASNTRAEQSIITISSGDGLPDAMQARDKISIALDGEGPLVSALQKALEAEMNSYGMGEFELAQTLQPAYPNPALVIKIGRPDLIWTPFFAKSQFKIQAGYASNGDTTFLGETPVTVDNKDGPALNMSADFEISDRSWGLISRPGYHEILADYMAQQIVAALKDQYE